MFPLLRLTLVSSVIICIDRVTEEQLLSIRAKIQMEILIVLFRRFYVSIFRSAAEFTCKCSEGGKTKIKQVLQLALVLHLLILHRRHRPTSALW